MQYKMVKTRPSQHAIINKAKTFEMIKNFFGKTLVRRVVTETIDDYGRLIGQIKTDTQFIGDLQFGLDLDKRHLNFGEVEIGDAVLYIYPDALDILPAPEDIIIDSKRNSKWRIHSQIEAAELGGTVCHYSYRCTRLIERGDTRK